MEKVAKKRLTKAQKLQAVWIYKIRGKDGFYTLRAEFNKRFVAYYGIRNLDLANKFADIARNAVLASKNEPLKRIIGLKAERNF